MTTEQLNQFIADVKNADRTDDSAFREIIQRSLKLFGLNDVGLADALNTGRSNVTRWKNGDSSPITPMKDVYFKMLAKRARTALKALKPQSSGGISGNNLPRVAKLHS